MNKFLIINNGSESKKYALYEGPSPLIFIHLEKTGKKFISTIQKTDQKIKNPISKSQFNLAFRYVLQVLKEENLIADTQDIKDIGLRIVAPGRYFAEHREISSVYLAKLKDNRARAPLHITAVLKEIKRLRSVNPRIKLYGISDSAFHQPLPDVAYYYAINKGHSDKFKLYRYGYHGLSIQSILQRLHHSQPIPQRLIICHLGGGASITALKNGKSIDTSMGFTPLEGLTMATRSGDIDPGAILYLGQKLHLTHKQLNRYLNEKSGLLGLSQSTSDIRELLKKEHNEDEDASLALNHFAYKVKKYIGSYTAVLGGLDMLIFTGTVGLRSAPIRKKICANLKHLNIHIDSEKNNSTQGIEGEIHDHTSIPILVGKTDEMKIIASETNKLISKK